MLSNTQFDFAPQPVQPTALTLDVGMEMPLYTAPRQHEKHQRSLSLDPRVFNDRSSFAYQQAVGPVNAGHRFNTNNMMPQVHQPHSSVTIESQQHSTFNMRNEELSPSKIQTSAFNNFARNHIHSIPAFIASSTAQPDFNEAYNMNDLTKTNQPAIFSSAEAEARFNAEFAHLFNGDSIPDDHILEVNEKESNEFCPEMSKQASDTVDRAPRPQTPVNQLNHGYFPTPPATVTHHQCSPKRTGRAAQTSPVRRGKTGTSRAFCATPTAKPKATLMQRGHSSPATIPMMSLLDESSKITVSSHTVPMPCSSTFDMAPIPRPAFTKFSSLSTGNGYNPSNYSPSSNRVTPCMSPISQSLEFPASYTSPIAHPVLAFPAPVTKADPLNFPVSSESPEANQTSDEESNVRPFEDLVDYSKDVGSYTGHVETGITEQEIDAFILPPDPNDRKGVFQCLWPDCNKANGFPRKENVKSHVQTHLGDRQFQCKLCDSRFVRQHDLKRHLGKHSGIKEHTCQCGSKFARADALTRHRERHMCVGKFLPGQAPKETKRGRPRKNRPEMEERLDKAARSRRNQKEKAVATPEPTVSAWPAHPSLDKDFDEFVGYGDAEVVAHSMAVMCSDEGLNSLDLAPTPTQYTQWTSAYEAALMKEISDDPELPNLTNSGPSQPQSVGSSPPELELVSSSPTASRYFDFDAVDELFSQADSSSENSKPTDNLALPQFQESIEPSLYGDHLFEEFGANKMDEPFWSDGPTDPLDPFSTSY